MIKYTNAVVNTVLSLGRTCCLLVEVSIGEVAPVTYCVVGKGGLI
jgi:hypothetical protein